MTVRRHPVRGFLGGLLLGIGLAFALLIAGVAPLGEYTVIVIVVVLTVLGLIAALAWPSRRPTCA